mgnify:CR=1 FL=1|tara:strand:+ start:623 stop:844 length:222 start_codon:yes stop_codon:yes gene_type:complete
MDNFILGISCYQQFDVATLLRNDEIIATPLEESPYKKSMVSVFLRKHFYLLKSQGINLSDINILYFTRNFFLY